jgi:hypothetical protein
LASDRAASSTSETICLITPALPINVSNAIRGLGQKVLLMNFM